MEQEYADLILGLTSDFEKSLQNNEEEKERLVQSFRKYLELGVDTIKASNSKFISKDPETIKRVLTKTTREFCDMDITSVKQRLLKDESFEKIRIISVEAFELAKRKKMGENVEVNFDYTSKLNELRNLLKKVASYNVGQARKLVSEAVLDLEFICQSKVRASSLRLYNFMNNIEKKNEEEEK